MEGDKKIEPYKTIERYCIRCGEVVDFPMPKKEKGELFYPCRVCGLPYKVKLISNRLEVPQFNPEGEYWVAELSISVDFDITSWEFGEGNSKIRKEYFKKRVDRRKKHL